jgi:hypothetical protein
MTPISVYVAEQVDSSADVRWDRESSAVLCTVEYMPTSAPDAPTLSEHLDKQLGIGGPHYVLTGGAFSMSLDSRKRIRDVELYTNPDRWSIGVRPFLETMPATVYFGVAFDDNGRADDIGEPDIFYEPERGTLYLCWTEAANWYEVAPGLAFGVTHERHFAQLRLDGLFMPKSSR